jgi:hypothetical protein
VWSLWRFLAARVASIFAFALLTEKASGGLEKSSKALCFLGDLLGPVVLALPGTISDAFDGRLPRQNRMGLVICLCIGSSIQAPMVINTAGPGSRAQGFHWTSEPAGTPLDCRHGRNVNCITDDGSST